MGWTLVAWEAVTFPKGTFAARRRAVLAPIPDLQHRELLAAAGAESVVPRSLDFRRRERSPLSREPVENTSIVAASEWVHQPCSTHFDLLVFRREALHGRR
jgi:hypothetical protein